eukprot:c16800_g2_i1 orf=314-1786(+)
MAMAGVCLSSRSRAVALRSTEIDFIGDEWGIPEQDVHQNECFWRINGMLPSGRRRHKYCLDFRLENSTTTHVPTSKLQESEQSANDDLISQGRPCHVVEDNENLHQWKSYKENKVEKDVQSAEQICRVSSLGIRKEIGIFHRLEHCNEKEPGCSKILGTLPSAKQHGVKACLESEEIRKEHWDSCTKDRNHKDDARPEHSLSQGGKKESENATMRDGAEDEDSSSALSTESDEFSSFASTANKFFSCEEDSSSCKELIHMKEEMACSRRDRNFPPPLTTDTIYTTVSDLPIPMPKVHLRCIKTAGRLVMKEMNSRPQLLFKAQRKDGRLQVRLVKHDPVRASEYSTAADHQETETRRIEDPLLHADKDAQWEAEHITKVAKGSQRSKETENLSNKEHKNKAMLQREEVGPKADSISLQNGDEKQGSAMKAKLEDAFCADLANPKARGDTAPRIQSNAEDAFPSLWALIAEPWSYCPARVQLNKDAPAYIF